MGHLLEGVSPKVFRIGDMEQKGVTLNNILPEKRKDCLESWRKRYSWSIYLEHKNKLFQGLCLIYCANNTRQLQTNLQRLMPNEVKP